MNVISLGFRTDLMLRAMAGSVIDDRGTHIVVRTPANPGYWWGNFVLTGSPPEQGDAARWSAVFAEEFPDARHLALGVDATGEGPGDSAELARLGVTASVDTVLTATRLRPPARPLGAETAEIRPLRDEEDWAQAAELRFATEEAPMTDEHRAFLDGQLAEIRGLCAAGHGSWFGAFVDGRMCAGAGLFADGSGIARFQNVETHPGFRRRGFASALVHHIGEWGVRELGARTLVIIADPGYHAIGIYRSLGFEDTECRLQLLRAPDVAA